MSMIVVVLSAYPRDSYPQHDLPGAAAFAFRTVAALDGVVEVLSWWTVRAEHH